MQRNQRYIFYTLLARSFLQTLIFFKFEITIYFLTLKLGIFLNYITGVCYLHRYLVGFRSQPHFQSLFSL